MDGEVIIKTELDTKSFDEEIALVERKLNDMISDYNQLAKEDGFNEQSNNAIILRENIEKVNNRLVQLKQRQSELNKVGFAQITTQLSDIGNSMSKVIKKVVKWGLAIFGIRSAYMAVRNAINVIAGDDEQLKADIDYIKGALAYALEPVVRAIVNLVKQLLVYIGYIIKQWTGYNIFENANKSLQKTNKQAKELKKSLAGFDEMNIVGQKDTEEQTSPSFDFNQQLKDLENGKVPKWLEDIVNAGKWIIDNWEDVVGLLLLTKLFFDLITGNWAGVIMDVILFLVTQIPRLWDAIQVVWDGIVAFGKWLWDGIVYIATHFEDIIGGIGNFIGNVIQVIVDLFVRAIDGIKNGFKIAGNFIKDIFSGIVNFFKGIIDKIVSLFKNIGTKVGNVLASTFKGVINGVLKAIETILNSPIKAINGLIKTVNKIPGINLSKLKTFDLPRLAKGGIINQPGAGVMVGGAIAGERGAEAVVPLTDSQQMELLGSTIGKYITINATIPVYAYNRQVDKQIRKIKAEDDFAYNR